MDWWEWIWIYNDVQEGSVTWGDLVTVPPQKTDSSEKTKVAFFFDPVVANNNTEKVVERITGDNGEVVEPIISKAL